MPRHTSTDQAAVLAIGQKQKKDVQSGHFFLVVSSASMANFFDLLANFASDFF